MTASAGGSPTGADVYFLCPSCRKSLAVPEAAVGRVVSCPDCGNSIEVPAPAMRWTCSCGAPMCAPSSLTGLLVQCTACGQKTIASATHPGLREPSAAEQRPATETASGERSKLSVLRQRGATPTQTETCPSCGAGLVEGAVLCVACGLNVRSGTRLRTTRHVNWAPLVAQFGKAAALVALVGLGFLYRESISEHLKSFFSRKSTAVAGATNQTATARRASQSSPTEQLLSDVREAQVKILIGKFAEARADLKKIALTHPEVYTAKRLTELLDLFDRIRDVVSDDGAGETLGRAAAQPDRRVPAFEAILVASMRSDGKVSVDPDTVETLTSSLVDGKSLNVAATTSNLVGFLKPIGLIAVPVRGTNGATIFVTTRGFWAYSSALAKAYAGREDEAIKVLLSGGGESSEFGMHCKKFAEALRRVNNRNQRLQSISANLKKVLNDYQLAKNRALTGAAASQTSMSPRARDAARNYAGAGMADADLALQSALQSLRQYVLEVEMSNTTIFERWRVAMDEDLLGEARFLLSHMLHNYESLLGMIDSLKGSFAAAGDGGSASPAIAGEADGDFAASRGGLPNLGSIPEEIGELQNALEQRGTMAEFYVSKGDQSSRDSMDQAGVDYATALFLDRGNVNARIGRGLHLLQAHREGFTRLTRLLKPGFDMTNEVTQLEQEFRSKEYNGLLEKLGAFMPEPATMPAEDVVGQIGSVKGLAVSAGGGTVFPLMVQIQDEHPGSLRSAASSERAEAGGYWKSFSVTEALAGSPLDYPVAFGDWGGEDHYAVMSALQMYGWLSYISPATFSRRGKGVLINWHELEAPKAGDSAGAALAVAAYSAFTTNSVRQNVAMTGSIRADGAVKAIGGVATKIDGAYREGGVDLIIVPKANKADLAEVPLEELLRIVVITEDDIRSYLTYALERYSSIDDVRLKAVVKSSPKADAQPKSRADAVCAACGGFGKMRCQACGGRGSTEKPDQKSCGHCGGSGQSAKRFSKTSAVCPFCAGRGYTPTTAWKTCETCGGTGSQSCPKCNASGRQL